MQRIQGLKPPFPIQFSVKHTFGGTSTLICVYSFQCLHIVTSIEPTTLLCRVVVPSYATAVSLIIRCCVVAHIFLRRGKTRKCVFLSPGDGFVNLLPGWRWFTFAHRDHSNVEGRGIALVQSWPSFSDEKTEKYRREKQRPQSSKHWAGVIRRLHWKRTFA